MVADNSQFMSVSWSPYGKILTNTKAGGASLAFGYNAMQQRVLKRVVLAGDTTRTYYIRDAQGNTMGVYTRHNDSVTWREQYIFGSSRLGLYRADTLVNKGLTQISKLYEGKRNYELTNHLGNVLAVINDRKTDTLISSVRYYNAVVISASDYYPFGMGIDSRTYSFSSYRYGFNAQERDNEINSNSYTAEFWEYDARICRRWNQDPKSNISTSPFATFENNPIRFIDHDGMKPIDDILLDHNGKETGRIKNNMGDRYFTNHESGEYTFNGEKYTQVNSPNTLMGDIKNDERHNKWNGSMEWIPDSDAKTIVDDRMNNMKRKYSATENYALSTFKILAVESMEQGQLDYVNRFKDGTIYYIQGIFYNSHEALNLMWGASLERMGLGLNDAIQAAHYYHGYAWATKGKRYRAVGMVNEVNHDLSIAMGYNLFTPNHMFVQGTVKPVPLGINYRIEQKTIKEDKTRAQYYSDHK